MQTRQLGPFSVSAIGLGCMPFSLASKELPSEVQAIATIHAALDAGVTFLDTADVYAPSWDTMGHNEVIVGKAIKAYGGDRDAIVVGTKGGITRSAGEQWGRDGSDAYLRGAVEKSLRALNVDVIDLYQWHRPDTRVAFADGVATFKALRDEGKIKAVGVSNASRDEINTAVEILGEGGLASVQNRFSPISRYAEAELELCGQNGVAFLPYSPLGGASGAKDIGGAFAAFGEIAVDHGVSPQQVVLAWELSLGDHVIPIPGASRPASILDSAKAVHLELTGDELARCSATSGLR